MIYKTPSLQNCRGGRLTFLCMDFFSCVHAVISWDRWCYMIASKRLSRSLRFFMQSAISLCRRNSICVLEWVCLTECVLVTMHSQFCRKPKHTHAEEAKHTPHLYMHAWSVTHSLSVCDLATCTVCLWSSHAHALLASNYVSTCANQPPLYYSHCWSAQGCNHKKFLRNYLSSL